MSVQENVHDPNPLNYKIMRELLQKSQGRETRCSVYRTMMSLFLIVVLSVVSQLSYAYDFEHDGIQYTINSGTATCYVSGNDGTVTDVVIPATVNDGKGNSYSVTSIGNNAFQACKTLTSVKVPESVTTIGSDAFASCSNMVSVELPESATTIKDAAFLGCSSLVSINLPTSLWGIAYGLFFSCRSLTNIELPASVRYIGSAAFANCSGLTSIELPTSLGSIASAAFSGCTGLTSIKLPASVTDFDTGACLFCDNLVEINVDEANIAYASEDGILYSKDLKSLLIYPVGRKAETFTVPDFVTNIGANAFSTCPNLVTANIPASVTSIGVSPFQTCQNLVSIHVDDANTAYKAVDGVLYTKSMLTLCQYPVGKEDKSFSIPEGVKYIAGFSFIGTVNLTSVFLPESVTNIGIYAFSGCKNLTYVKLPETLKTIERATFSSCPNLTSIVIPSSVISIGRSAFENCESLTSIYALPTTPPVCDNTAFYTGGSMFAGERTLYVPYGCSEVYRNAETWKDFTNITEMAGTAIRETRAEGQDLSINMSGDVMSVGGDFSIIKDIAVADASGRIRMTAKDIRNGATIGVAQLPKGLYIVNVTTDEGTCMKKVIKK